MGEGQQRSTATLYSQIGLHARRKLLSNAAHGHHKSSSPPALVNTMPRKITVMMAIMVMMMLMQMVAAVRIMVKSTMMVMMVDFMTMVTMMTLRLTITIRMMGGGD